VPGAEEVPGPSVSRMAEVAAANTCYGERRTAPIRKGSFG